MRIFNLRMKIATSLPIAPEFMKNPHEYAAKHNVALVGLGQSDDAIRSHDEPTSEQEEKLLEKEQAFYLIKDSAVKIFIVRDKQGTSLLKSIQVNLNELPWPEDSDVWITDAELADACKLIGLEITKLLTHAEDASLIIPEVTPDDKSFPYWSQIQYKVFLPNLKVSRFYQLQHPDGSKPEGTKKKRLKLEAVNRGYTLLMEDAKDPGHQDSRQNKADRIEGIRLTLILKGDALLHEFRTTDAYSNFRPAKLHQGKKHSKCLVDFGCAAALLALHMALGSLSGRYIPAPAVLEKCSDEQLAPKAIGLLCKKYGLSPEMEVEEFFHGRQCTYDEKKEFSSKVAAACKELRGPAGIHLLGRLAALVVRSMAKSARAVSEESRPFNV
jgi:hypothetical protein